MSNTSSTTLNHLANYFLLLDNYFSTKYYSGRDEGSPLKDNERVKKLRMLDLFCGRFGWSRAFAAKGWECFGVDLVEPPEIPRGCEFVQADILDLRVATDRDGKFFYLPNQQLGRFDFACASSPCEKFSVFAMPHFHPNPPYPEQGVELFNHTRAICETSGLPYIMENVRAAQQFIGQAVSHAGPFYLWGNAVPPILPQGFKKGFQTGGGIIQKLKRIDRKALTDYRRLNDLSWSSSGSAKRKEFTAKAATIPPELSACVVEYAERLIEQANQQEHGDFRVRDPI